MKLTKATKQKQYSRKMLKYHVSSAMNHNQRIFAEESCEALENGLKQKFNSVIYDNQEEVYLEIEDIVEELNEESKFDTRN